MRGKLEQRDIKIYEKKLLKKKWKIKMSIFKILSIVKLKNKLYFFTGVPSNF